MVDLHTHSNASDGDFSPAQLLREGKKRGITVLALTDHDTLGGLGDAQNEANALGVRFIPGIEISIDWKRCAGVSGLGPGGEMHLLGLGIKTPSPAFMAAISELSRRREDRNREILDSMNAIGIEATWDDILAESGSVSANQAGAPVNSLSIGRPHFASFLVKKKIVRNRDQAFARYLRPGKPLYVPKAGLLFEQAVAIIRESGGIPVLAHPMSLYVAWGCLPGLVKALKSRGLMGIEAWHPIAKAKACRRLEELGRELDLYITEGSDFHGAARRDRQLGISNKGREINDSVLEAIPELQ
ncbi:MAG: PHP domain-containing protein [Treponema sp.]|nr:PHP domain-containing protein [Treponema sp.]